MARPSARLSGWLAGGSLVVFALVLAVALVYSVNDGLLAAAMLAGCGFAAVIVLGGAINLSPDDTRSEATERTLRVATGTLSHLHGGLTEENARAICALLLPETSAVGIAITDTEAVLALEGARVHDALLDDLVFAEGARLFEHLIDQRRLAVIDVGDDRNVP